jgi:hypothetical protein
MAKVIHGLDNIVVVLEGGGLETRQLGLAMQRLAD